MKRSFPSKEKAMVKPTREKYLFPGVSTKLFECRRDKHDTVYLCGRCSRKITEEDIVDHVTDLNHQKMRRVVVNLGEKTYNDISKQSFYSALHTLKALNLQRNRLNIRTSALKPSSAGPGNASAALHVQHVGSTVDNFEVVSGEERNSPADRVIDMPMTQRVQVPSSEAQTKTFMKLSMSAGNFHHQFNNFGKRALNVPPKGSRVVRFLPYSRGNGSKDVTPSAICKKAATPPKMKRSAVISPSMPTISKCTKTSSARMGTNSSATSSRMASTSKIVPMSRTLEGERTATEAKSASFNAARATGLHEATCRTDALSRHKNAPSTAANASTTFQTKLTSVAIPKGPKPGSENANAYKKVHMENSLKANAATGPHANKGNPPAAPHLKTTLPAASEHKRQHKEPSHISAGTKQSGNHPKVGLNQLIIVSWEGKQQVYCQLCSVRLKRSDHPLSLSHQYNYVKTKYPGWTETPAELESKLKNIVAHLAEVEKNLGSQNAQKVEVKKEVYQKLAALPENEAVERVKVLVGPRDPRVPFSSSEETAEVVRQEVTSPCEVSSSDDVSGALVPFSEVPGFAAKSQLMQETKTERQKLLDQITEKKSRLTTENDLAVYQSVRGQGLDGDLIHHQLPSSGALNKKHPLPIPAASSQAEVKPETVKREPLDPDGDAQPHSEVTLVTQTPAVKVEKTDHSQHLVNPDIRQEQKSDQTSREPQNDLESKQKLTPYQINSPNLEAATVSTGQLDQSGPSHSEGPREPKISQAFTVIKAGRIIQGSSHLSIFLKASRQDAKPIIGMDLVWECRGMSLETFFLCESCEETVSCRDICQHMASLDHQLKYIWREHPEFLRMFWHDESLPYSEKVDLVKRIVKELSERERFHKVDAQCVLLGKELHQFVKTSSFCEALKMVCDIKDEEKPNIVFLPIDTRQKFSQQPEDCYSPVLKEQMTDQRSDSGVSSRLEGDYSPVKAESVSPVPVVGTSFTLQDTRGGLYLQPEFKPAISQFPKSEVKQEVVFESASLDTVGSTISQNPEMLPRNKCPPSRKRPVDTSEDPLPAKCISSPVQVKGEPSSPSISEFPSVNPAVNSTPRFLNHEDPRPSHNESAVNWNLFSELISMLKKSNFQFKAHPSGSVPDHPINPRASSSSETAASRWDSKMVKTKSEAAMNKRRWDSKCLLVKATVSKTNSNSIEGMKTEAPADLEYENQFTNTGVHSASASN